ACARGHERRWRMDLRASGCAEAIAPRREIATKWRCQRDGTCCLALTQIVVTREEWAAMQAARSLSLTPEPLERNFLRLPMPNGCLHLTRELDGRAICRIYEARPVNCRRFQCQRPDVTTEPWEDGGPLGCRNLSDRLDQ